MTHGEDDSKELSQVNDDVVGAEPDAEAVEEAAADTSLDSDTLAYGRASGLSDTQSEHLSTYL